MNQITLADRVVLIKNLPRLIRNLKSQKKSIVLVGGCFDILHPGHVIFLEKAKATGDVLMVLLEDDQKVKKLKGVNRPFHNQRQRARVLSALRSVDFVVMLPYIKKEEEYDQIVKTIKPDTIAVTYGQGNLHHHQRSAKLVRAKLKYVTKFVGNHSTSRILDVD